ncbi:heavy-metal-associated domain-containing protein [Pseudoclavibacter endophyticus]|uniref:Heavy-metal-associated domain-containing protein n=1 Tax=Pseudoclavibacter endophyticus TaxID=1778590 RepID=A0A6H9WNM5_9MICO|nr:heavy metal-associated domain-containing protein [Pseudoclavibacter endophyticus]KAB1650456.1 heavy-metal-associated domain-containing protein [Pseudoclavibacter endophyticus]
MTTEYVIAGMSCAHCERAVAGELQGIDGVEHVDVSAERGTATVTSERALDPETVRAAVDEAGYELAGSEGRS